MSQTNAQIHEVGVFLGGSNYIGDVGPTNYIAPNEPAFGLVYKWNRSTRHSFRFSLMHSQISSRDVDSDTPGRSLRGYEFKNAITEASAGLEFNFFNFNLHELERQITPYIHTGISFFIYDEQYVLDGETETDYREHSLAIPMTLGFKGNITPSLVLGIEAGARYTFTDNLDGSNPKNDNLEPLRFGNINSKDWYVFTGFTLTYTFGEKPCFCAE
jgi:hypothetical protein